MPTINDGCTAGIGMLLFTLGKLAGHAEHPFNYELRIASGNSSIAWPVHYQRNRIVKMFLESESEWLWFIDSDVRPSIDSVKLLDLLDKADIVAGIYPMHGGATDPIVWSVYEAGTQGGFRPMILPEGDAAPVVKAAAAATGAMLIHRRVLADPEMHFAPDDEDGTPALFRTPASETGKVQGTDDLDFCKRAVKYTILVDTSVRWGHMKHSDVARTVEAMDWGFSAGKRYAQAVAEEAQCQLQS